MRKKLKIVISLLVCCILSISFFTGCRDKTVIPDDKDKNKNEQYITVNKERAISYAKKIKELYWNSETQTSKLIPEGGTPYLWPYTEQVSMANAVFELLDEKDEDYEMMKNYLKETLEGLRYYRVRQATGFTNTEFGVLNESASSYAMYNSGKSNTKDMANNNKDGIYFDDNIWVAKEYYYAYLNLGDQKYLNEAINIVNWIIGEGFETAKDVKTGKAMNGIYWLWGAKDKHPGITDDTKNASLNACSSAPTAMMLVKLYNVMTDPKFDAVKAKYLATAKQIFMFVYNTLLDEETNTIKDKVFVNADSENNLYLGIIDAQILPYNTGCMLTAGKELYFNAVKSGQNTNAEYYKKWISDMSAGSDLKFASRNTVEGQYSYHKNSWFTSFLLEGYIDVASTGVDVSEYIEHMRSALDYAWNNNKAEDGLVAPSWIVGWSEYPDTGVSEGNGRQILLQAANAHCYAMLAKYYSSLD
ncbi:MAG TPA: hypothetical protein VIL26_02460 [Clostridia bacterium]